MNLQNNFPLHNLSLEQLENIFFDLFLNENQKISQAYSFAKVSHGKQLRDNGNPYIVHPLRICLSLKNDYKINDSKMLIASLLHDVVEDCNITYYQIKELFGNTVTEYVEHLTRERITDEDLYPEIKLKAKIEKYNYYLKASKEVKLIKMIDLIDNMGDWPILITLGSSSVKKLPRWIYEYENYVIPLAESLDSRFSKQITWMIKKIKKEYKLPENIFLA